MLRCFALVTVVTVFVVICFAKAEELKTNSSEWTGIEPLEMVGMYMLTLSDTKKDLIGMRQCIQSITIETVERLSFASWGIPHDRIRQDGVRCSSDGMMIALSRYAIERSGASGFILTEQPLVPLVGILDQSHIPFILGVEQTERVCGESVTHAFSLAVFLRMPEDKTLPLISSNLSITEDATIGPFRPGVKYMIVYNGGEKVCTYIGISDLTPEAADASPSEEESEQRELESAAPSTEPEFSLLQTPGMASPLAMPIPPPETPTITVSLQPSASAPASVSASETWDDTDMTTISAAPTDWEDSLSEIETEEPSAVTVEPSQDATQEGVSDSSPACFPADAHVVLADGRIVRMDSLSPGTAVASGREAFSHVHGFSHRFVGSTLHKFVQVVTFGGTNLTATGGHYVYKFERVDSQERPALVTMDEIRIGDRLLKHDGNKSTVVGIQTVWKRGLINPHTLNGDIIVNGFVASCYTRHVGSYTSQALLVPLRAIFRISGACVSVFEKGVPSLIARWLLKGQANASI